jgi:hypothetical protein
MVVSLAWLIFRTTLSNPILAQTQEKWNLSKMKVGLLHDLSTIPIGMLTFQIGISTIILLLKYQW